MRELGAGSVFVTMVHNLLQPLETSNLVHFDISFGLQVSLTSAVQQLLLLLNVLLAAAGVAIVASHTACVGILLVGHCDWQGSTHLLS